LFLIDSTGYARIILALISIYFMPTNYKIACTCYVVSALLDAFDGHAARTFNQSKIIFNGCCNTLVVYELLMYCFNYFIK